jgi:hypothetical protein
MDEATKQTVKDTALALLGLPAVQGAPGSIEVVATYLATREPEEGMRESIGRVLADRARLAIDEKTDGGATGIASARVDFSDDADCEDHSGVVGNAFIRGERCYRLVLQVAVQD